MIKYDTQDIIDAVQYGFDFRTESQNNGKFVPLGNILQWIMGKKRLLNVPKEFKGDVQLESDLYELPTRRVCFFKLKGGKFMTENGVEITTDMLTKYSHQITEVWSFIILD